LATVNSNLKRSNARRAKDLVAVASVPRENIREKSKGSGLFSLWFTSNCK